MPCPEPGRGSAAAARAGPTEKCVGQRTGGRHLRGTRSSQRTHARESEPDTAHMPGPEPGQKRHAVARAGTWEGADRARAGTDKTCPAQRRERRQMSGPEPGPGGTCLAQRRDRGDTPCPELGRPRPDRDRAGTGGAMPCPEPGRGSAAAARAGPTEKCVGQRTGGRHLRGTRSSQRRDPLMLVRRGKGACAFAAQA